MSRSGSPGASGRLGRTAGHDPLDRVARGDQRPIAAEHPPADADHHREDGQAEPRGIGQTIWDRAAGDQDRHADDRQHEDGRQGQQRRRREPRRDRGGGDAGADQHRVLDPCRRRAAARQRPADRATRQLGRRDREPVRAAHGECLQPDQAGVGRNLRRAHRDQPEPGDLGDLRPRVERRQDTRPEHVHADRQQREDDDPLDHDPAGRRNRTAQAFELRGLMVGGWTGGGAHGVPTLSQNPATSTARCGRRAILGGP